ncbi:MAG: DsbA family protein [Kordiimonadaceae bacterium]|nr:DsbA family protein [Kordiimonadaceae bacterium]MBT7544071.1 DsbA family protein [Kordiimonadaceae bacterium]MBT7604929.1 DsbA family protein [Kordiimonadaceae bacterium]
MKTLKLLRTFLFTMISIGMFSFIGNTQQSVNNFNIEQKNEIKKMIRNYILEYPEIIPEAVEVLRSRQNISRIKDSQNLLYNDGYSFVAGNKNGDVTLVEFYDYNCGYCKQVPDVLARLIEEDKNLKVIFKELPILAETSQFASVAAMASMKQGKFSKFHSAMMKNKRALTENLILKIATDSGIDEAQLLIDMEDPKIEENIMKTKYLVQNIGISGTPGFVIGNQIIPGFIPYEKLKAIITKERETQNM